MTSPVDFPGPLAVPVLVVEEPPLERQAEVNAATAAPVARVVNVLRVFIIESFVQVAVGDRKRRRAPCRAPLAHRFPRRRGAELIMASWDRARQTFRGRQPLLQECYERSPTLGRIASASRREI